MAVVLRLQRHGKTHKPFYRIVAADVRAPTSGRPKAPKFIEKLGYYDPNQNPSIMKVDAEAVQKWYGLGATVTPPVKAILKAQKVAVARKSTHKEFKKK